MELIDNLFSGESPCSLYLRDYALFQCKTEVPTMLLPLSIKWRGAGQAVGLHGVRCRGTTCRAHIILIIDPNYPYFPPRITQTPASTAPS